MKKPKVVTSFGAYVTHLEKHCRIEELLFRGQQQAWPLLPKIARADFTFKGQTRRDVEKQVFEMFKRKCIPYVDKQLRQGPLELLTIAQNHGLPTRLLDWSRNPLAALWFAVQKPASDREGGAVWVLDHSDKQLHDLIVCEEKPDTVWDWEHVKLYCPSDVSPRLIAQSGCFTVHPLSPGSENTYIALEESGFRPFLQRLDIPASAFCDMRYQLDRCGVNEEALFRDLVGVCRHIEWYHTRLTDEQEGGGVHEVTEQGRVRPRCFRGRE